MTLESGHPGTSSAPDKWLLTRSVARDDRLPGKLLLPEGREWLNVVRVILLIPDVPLHIERVVWLFEALDLPRKTQIVLAELANASKGHARRRQLDTLLTHIQQVYPAAYGKRLYEPDWPSAMRAFAGRHDLLVTTTGQYFSQGALTGQPLSQILLNTLNLPILEITGIFPPWPARLASWITRGLFNLFPFLVVGAFFWAQSRIGSQAQGWVNTFAIGATIVVEFTIIFIWSLFLD